MGQARGLQQRPAFGGNKTRKLEYLVPDVLPPGLTRSSRSGLPVDHTRQVAAVGAHLGLKVRLVQEKWVDWDDPVNDRVGNILLSRIMGADVRLDPSGFDIGIRRSWEDALADVEASGASRTRSRRARRSTLSVGWALPAGPTKVAEQERRLGVFFDTVVVCTVTGSTHAGMVAGFAALEDAGGRPRRVIGIDASATIEKTRDQVWRIATHTAELIGLGREYATRRSRSWPAGRGTATASRSSPRSRRSG